MELDLTQYFEVIEKNKNIKVADVKVEKYSIDIFLTNVFRASVSSMSQVENLFNIKGITGTVVDDGLYYKLSIPRVEVPDKAYKLLELMKSLKETDGNSWILGISDFGPKKFDIDTFTHGNIFGASGYGKSSFFRFLLTQTLAFHSDVINYIVDPKQVDFELYEDHPNVMKRVVDYTGWMNLFFAILIEIEVRKYYFTTAFEKAPVKLSEYLDLRKSFERLELPEFKRMFIWIDEAHVVFGDRSHMDLEATSLIKGIIRQARAFGIHFIFSSQRFNDIPTEIRSQIPNSFFFYSPMKEGKVLDIPDRDHVQAIRGRLGAIVGEKLLKNIQAPFLVDDESIAVSYILNNKPVEMSDKFKDGFYRIHIAKQIIEDKSLLKALVRGESLHNFLSKVAEKEEESDRWRRSSNDKIDLSYLTDLYGKAEKPALMSSGGLEFFSSHGTAAERNYILDKILRKRENINITPEEAVKTYQDLGIRVDKYKEEDSLDEKSKEWSITLRFNEIYKEVYDELSAEDVEKFKDIFYMMRFKEAIWKRKMSESEVINKLKNYANDDTLTDEITVEELLGESGDSIEVISEKKENLVEIEEVNISLNKVNINGLIEKYKPNYDKSEFGENLSWCMRDLSRNKLINLCYKNMLKHKKTLDIIDSSSSVNFEDLALTETNERLGKKYIEEVKKIEHTEQSGPLLVLYGESGVGKRTLLEAISTELKMPIRESNKSDLILDMEDSDFSRKLKEENKLTESKQEEIEKEEVNENDELVIFTDIEMALTFVKKPKGNIHPVLFYEVKDMEKVIEVFTGSSPVKEKVKYLNQFNLFIEMRTKDYADQKVLNKLVKALLKKYHFVFDNDKKDEDYGVLFAKHKVALSPEKIDPIIERAFYRAKSLEVEFNLSTLEEILNDFSNANLVESHGAVDSITPSRTLDDLIISEQNRKDLTDAIHFAKSVDMSFFRFRTPLQLQLTTPPLGYS